MCMTGFMQLLSSAQAGTLALLTRALFQHEHSPGWREEMKANQLFPRAELVKGGKAIATEQGQVSQAAWASRDKCT